MEIIGWEKLFEPHILNRGREYYESELVDIENSDHQTIEATVDGSDIYSVEITLRGNRVDQMHCDCPYASDGYNCKHMAAVLFAATDSESSVPLAEKPIAMREYDRPAIKDKSLEQTIKELSEEQMRSLLLYAAQKYGDINDRIMLIEKKEVDPSTRKQWSSTLRNISRRASDRHGFIDYYHASDYINQLEQYMDDTVSPLIEYRLIMDAFDLVGLVFAEAMSQDIDDSGGELTYIADICADLWEELIPAPESDQTKMLQWFERQIKRFDGYAAEDWLWDTVFEDFTDDSLLPKILEMLDKKISAAADYELERQIGQRIALMERMNMSGEQINEYRMKYWDKPFIRNQKLDRLESAEKWNEALELICECERMDAENYRLMKDYGARRIRILKKSGQDSSYVAALKSFVLNFFQNDMTFVTELKQAVSPEEWSELLDVLFQNENTRWLRRSLQFGEGMLEQMMDEIEKERNYSDLVQYEKELRELYPERVRDLIIYHLDNEMRTASKRSAYYNVAHSLKRLFDYPDGRAKAAELVAVWKRDFPRRSAMIEELKKVKL